MYNFRMHFVDRLVWYKGGGQPVIAANVMNSRFEDVWILSPDKFPKRSIPTGKFQSTVPNVYEGRGASSENTEKANSSQKGDVVLDLFMGSGTTLIAAQTLGRRCFGMELDPKYADVVVMRFEQFSGKKAVRISDKTPTNAEVCQKIGV